jgi:uncharacterized protein YecE (DUF72 family)
MSSLYIGASAFTAAGWEGSFYPEGINADYTRVMLHFDDIAHRFIHTESDHSRAI